MTNYFYDDSLNMAILYRVKESLSQEERQQLETKLQDIFGNLGSFRDIDSRIVAEQMFTLGYLASFAHKDFVKPKCLDHEGDGCP